VVVTTGAVVGALVEGMGVVVVAGLCAGEPVASLTTANTRARSITPIAPAATSASGRRYQGVGGGFGCPVRV
jgi:hypothetical protein